MKYIIVTGGVVSGLGKGVTISSMGRLLQSCGLSVTAIKIDPYLNVDAGTMSPFEHGEVFVLEDGGEGDLDLGNYERFLNLKLTSDHNITTGKIYREVILKERRGDYLGKTVQVVPHITNEIQDWIERAAQIPTSSDPNKKDQIADICLIEVGGTVGDIESSVFLEALRQFQFRVGHDNFCLSFVSLVPFLSDEQKTKPTQHGVKDLRSLGLSPQIIFCRSSKALLPQTKKKISDFCHVEPGSVISVHDVDNVYQVPLVLEKQNLHSILQKCLFKQPLTIPPAPAAEPLKPDLTSWKNMADSVEQSTKVVKIALIGKYTGQQDSYLSVIKALKHSSIECKHTLILLWVEATHLEDDSNKENYDAAWSKVKEAHGIVVPGGFGDRGFLGKVLAVEYCRKNKVPFLGVCLGFQAMVVEFCRNIIGWEGATSTEFEECTTPKDVVIFMPEIDKETMGGTMRLGARKTKLTHTVPSQEEYLKSLPSDADGMGTINSTAATKNIPSLMSVMYNNDGDNTDEISERHRHRYEVNPKYVEEIHSKGLLFVGRDLETEERMEIAELPTYVHPYFVGTQYHPEFQSRPLDPSPPFYGLVLAACGMLDEYIAQKTQQ